VSWSISTRPRLLLPASDSDGLDVIAVVRLVHYYIIEMKGQSGYDHLAKLLIIGDSGVGKTNILLRFCENNFMSSHLTTIGKSSLTQESTLKSRRSRSTENVFACKYGIQQVNSASRPSLRLTIRYNLSFI
jgi:hypothetical protein